MMENMIRNAVVPLVLRFGLAVIFIYHGSQKIQED